MTSRFFCRAPNFPFLHAQMAGKKSNFFKAQSDSVFQSEDAVLVCDYSNKRILYSSSLNYPQYNPSTRQDVQKPGLLFCNLLSLLNFTLPLQLSKYLTESQTIFFLKQVWPSIGKHVLLRKVLFFGGGGGVSGHFETLCNPRGGVWNPFETLW